MRIITIINRTITGTTIEAELVPRSSICPVASRTRALTQAIAYGTPELFSGPAPNIFVDDGELVSSDEAFFRGQAVRLAYNEDGIAGLIRLNRLPNRP